MDLIPSFSVDHTKIVPGIFTSRVDTVGDELVTTYDIRVTKPNVEPAVDVAAMHSLEHLIATFLRNEPVWKDKVLYFGPMGCRTGFYLLLAGDYCSADIVSLMLDCFRFIGDFTGEVPGASAKDCGHYLDMDLPMANYWGKRYAALLENITDDRLVYPE